MKRGIMIVLIAIAILIVYILSLVADILETEKAKLIEEYIETSGLVGKTCSECVRVVIK